MVARPPKVASRSSESPERKRRDLPLSICGSSWIDAELMQYRSPVGGGPSLNTCPKWAPHRLHVTSVRIPKPGKPPSERSSCSAIVVPFTPSIGAVKLGQPHPLSNFSPERNNGSPQQMQR
jgi:hypothetical protein